MNTRILGPTVLSVLISLQGLGAETKKVEVSGLRKAIVVINLETGKTAEDGSYKDTVTKVCEGEITSPVYEVTNPQDGGEIAQPKVSLKRCLINLKGLEAEVVLNTYVIKYPSEFSTFDTKLSQIPRWLAPHVQVGSKSTAYLAYFLIVPKGFDPARLMGEKVDQLSAEEIDAFNKISQIIEVGGPAANVSILGKSTNPVILNHAVSASKDYCSKNGQDEYCSLNTKITAHIIFDGK